MTSSKNNLNFKFFFIEKNNRIFTYFILFFFLRDGIGKKTWVIGDIYEGEWKFNNR
jgi:hypothetical protein